MRVRIRSGYRSPFEEGEGGQIAIGVRDRSGSARAAAPFGSEALGARDRSGSAQPLLVRPGVRDRSGRASPRVGARGVRDRIGRATPAVAAADAFFYTYTIGANDDLAAATIANYVLRAHLVGDQFKQAPTGRLTDANAWDLRVQLLDGTNLDHEIDYYDAATGTIDINFRIPSYAVTSAFTYRLKLGSFT